jgi:hypothetical protein
LIEAIIGAGATVAVGILAWVQWVISKNAEDRHRRSEQQAEARQRDGEMTRWGFDVIELMAEVETAAFPISTQTKCSHADAERLGDRASALVDKGRLFFPNVVGGREGPQDEGTRVKLLDEVLRTCYVARHLAAEGDADREVLRTHVWQARRRFVSLLQNEMGPWLRQVGEDSKGDHVPLDPKSWDPPTRRLILPSRR